MLKYTKTKGVIMSQEKEESGRIAVPYSIIARFHKLRFKIAEPGKKIFLKELVIKALNEFLDKHENDK
jgi:hypothetical protein